MPPSLSSTAETEANAPLHPELAPRQHRRGGTLTAVLELRCMRPKWLRGLLNTGSRAKPTGVSGRRVSHRERATDVPTP